MGSLFPYQGPRKSYSLLGFILTVWLSCWIQQASCQGSGTDVIAAVGESVTLNAPTTVNIYSVYWYRDREQFPSQLIYRYFPSFSWKDKGAQYTGRESVLNNGSLQIRDLLTNYTGSYTVTVKSDSQPRISDTTNLRVFDPVSVPVIHAFTSYPVENGALVLFCSASGTNVSYQWYQGSHEVVSSRISFSNNRKTLTLSPCKRSDTGTIFSCQASNAVSASTSSPYIVTISYPVSVPVIHALTSYPVENGALVLFCSASGTDVSYRWYQNGLEVFSSRISFNNNRQTLTLSPCKMSDTGTIFSCRASNAVSASTSSLYIVIISSLVSVPVIHSLTENPIENRDLVLFCNSSGTDVSYRWYQEGIEVVSSGRFSFTNNRQTLILSPCRRSDSSTIFTCRASNAVSTKYSSPYSVTISYGPDAPVISASPEKEFYAESSSLTLSCAAASYPPASYTWQLNGKSLPTIGHELHINPLTLSDSGEYKCMTNNSVTQRSSQTSKEIHILEVLSQPTVRVSTQYPVEHRDTVEFTCDASTTTETILWFFNYRSIRGNIKINLYSNNQTLAISNVSRSHSGFYQCMAINRLSASRSDPQTLTVAYGPENVRISPHHYLMAHTGARVTLTCSTTSVPDVEYSWFLNDTYLNQHESQLVASVVSNSKDDGSYTCLVRNAITGQSANASVSLAVLGTPPPAEAPTSNWQIILGVAIGVFLVTACISIIAFLFYTRRNTTQRDENTHGEPNRSQDATMCYENVLNADPKQRPTQSTAADNTYEELQHRDQAQYESLKRYNADQRAMANLWWCGELLQS